MQIVYHNLTNDFMTRLNIMVYIGLNIKNDQELQKSIENF